MKRLVPHLAALIVIAGCVALTLWQLDRAVEKRELLERWHNRPIRALGSLGEPLDLPQPVRADGRWLADRQLLIDNRIRQRQPGVGVLTPLLLDDGRIVLVDRGWASWPARNAPLPDPKPRDSERVEISGRLAAPPGVGARMGPSSAGSVADWPRLVTWFNPVLTADWYGKALLPAVIRLDPGHPDHLTGDAWQIVAFGPKRHFGYALTWASIAIVVAGIWLVLGIRARRRTEN